MEEDLQGGQKSIEYAKKQEKQITEAAQIKSHKKHGLATLKTCVSSPMTTYHKLRSCPTLKQ